MKKSWKTIWVLVLALILCLGLASCGGGDSEDMEEPTVAEEVTHDPQTFTTTDEKYSFTVTSLNSGGVWAQPNSFLSEDASLEVSNYADGVYVTILSQDKAGLGYTLSSYHEEALSNMEANVSSLETESTEDVEVAGYPAKKSHNVYTGTALDGSEATHGGELICVETDTQYIQINVTALLDQFVEDETALTKEEILKLVEQYTQQILESFTVN